MSNTGIKLPGTSFVLELKLSTVWASSMHLRIKVAISEAPIGQFLLGARAFPESRQMIGHYRCLSR